MPPPTPTMTLVEFAAAQESAQQLVQASQRGGFAAPSRPAYHPSASALPAIRPWNQPGYQSRDPRKELKKKLQLLGIITLQELRERPAQFIAVHERPALAQAIAALQDEGTGQQDKEDPMDQSSDHNTPSEVGSSGRSTHSEATSEAQEAARAMLEVAAIQNFPDEVGSETPSKQNE